METWLYKFMYVLLRQMNKHTVERTILKITKSPPQFWYVIHSSSLSMDCLKSRTKSFIFLLFKKASFISAKIKIVMTTQHNILHIVISYGLPIESKQDLI